MILHTLLKRIMNNHIIYLYLIITNRKYKIYIAIIEFAYLIKLIEKYTFSDYIIELVYAI